MEGAGGERDMGQRGLRKSPNERQAIYTKWVLERKLKEDVTGAHYETRVVAEGFLQV